MRKFKKNIHIAKTMRINKVKRLIENYPKQFPTPKYLTFIKIMLENGWIVKLHTVKVSKYVFVIKDENVFKIRFSNHKPIYEKEIESDCDYYVGISHKQVSTTEQIISELSSI